MKAVDDETMLAEVLRGPRAVLALHARWSMPSVMALRTVEAWERDWVLRKLGGTFPVYVATADDEYPPPVLEWLGSQSLSDFATTGWGEVLWLEHGRVVDKLLFGVTAEALMERTRRLWDGSGRDCVR